LSRRRLRYNSVGVEQTRVRSYFPQTLCTSDQVSYGNTIQMPAVSP